MVSAAGRKSTLHLVCKAGTGAFEACRAACTAGDAVLFIDNGVRQLLLGEPGRLLPPGVAVHYSKPDLEARGLSAAAGEAQVRVLEDSEFTALLRDHRHCLSWK